MTSVYIPPKSSSVKESVTDGLSLGETQKLVEELVTKLKSIEHEEELLKEQKKQLLDDYSEKLDTKTLKLALRTAAIQEKVIAKDTFDQFMTVLERISS